MVDITISFTPSSDASEPSRLLRNEFDEVFSGLVAGERFATRVASIIVFVMIINPLIGNIPAEYLTSD
jgi:hypothetical protein